MPSRSIFLQDVFAFNGSLLSLGSSFVVTSFSPIPDPDLTFEDDDDDAVFEPSEAATIGGDPITDAASGTVTAGVSIGSLLTVNLSTSVPVNVLETASTTNVHYPEGDQAELLDALVTDVLATPGIGSTLSLLGITDVAAYVEQNALLTFDLSGEIAIPVCFAAGTRILTQQGEIDVKDLRVGDQVITRDHGFRPVRWIGAQTVRAAGKFAPIVFGPGAVGNHKRLVVSPEHRILLQHDTIDLLTGSPEAFTAAKHLVDGTSVRRVPGGEIEYFHILLDHHEIIYADQALCETFYPGSVAMRALHPGARKDLLSRFPDLGRPGAGSWQLARRALTRRETAVVLRAMRDERAAKAFNVGPVIPRKPGFGVRARPAPDASVSRPGARGADCRSSWSRTASVPAQGR
ncbi:Hint domain-containing protein [Palleronia pelagia]|uniref:Hint domain-containing protein n=2 Tax=Palleronia pelagia TaxID=387096 RepID=A0A1H8FL54_9RHOB|nr:Hint domain-containing protein [Palleronia pelagia]